MSTGRELPATMVVPPRAARSPWSSMMLQRTVFQSSIRQFCQPGSLDSVSPNWLGRFILPLGLRMPANLPTYC